MKTKINKEAIEKLKAEKAKKLNDKKLIKK
jgi:hypothetical protein